MTGHRQQPLKVTSLRWGVKESFRRYVEATGGAIETHRGAERTPNGEFAFASTESDLRWDANGKLDGHVKFLGEVFFKSHGGMLSVRLVDPSVEIDAARAFLTAAESDVSAPRLEIARLDVAAITDGESGDIVIPAVLWFDGSQVLGDHYPPTTALDPVRLVLAVD